MNLQKEFNNYLANLAVMTFKLHNLHWNVEGLQFTSIHKFTEDMYDKTFEYLDEIAEIQKIYGVTPDSKLSDYLNNATIKEVDAKKFTPKEALEIMLEDVKSLCDEATYLRNECDKLGWFTSASLLEGHIEYYSKQLWFIKATLG